MAEENKTPQYAPTPTPTLTAQTMKTQAPDAAQFKTAFEARKQESQNQINNTLDNNLATEKQGIQDAFQKNTAAQTQATNAGQQQFQFAKQDLDAQSARNVNNMNQYADVRNLNRQPGSQQSLALGLGRSVAAGQLARQQQMAAEESARRQALLETAAKNKIAQAVANNDYQKAAALLDDYNNQNAWLDKNSEFMANFGNFTGYEQAYGPDTAGAMRQLWIAQNPELAYNTGAIDEKRYEAMTGRKPPDWKGDGFSADGSFHRHTPDAREIYHGNPNHSWSGSIGR